MGRYVYQSSSLLSKILWTALLLSQAATILVNADDSSEACFANDSMNEFFATDEPTCCQNDVCALPCPEPVPAPTKGKLQ
jgi:hypothetical protein